jgi:hypothetical protein
MLKYNIPYISVSSETTGFPFRRLLRLAGITMELFLPASTRGTFNRLQALYKGSQNSTKEPLKTKTSLSYFYSFAPRPATSFPKQMIN